jgi:chromosome segregation ATPase
MLAELEAWQQRLERDITDLEHRVKVAAFEAESLEMTLNELRQQADEIAAELEEENGFSEKH